MSPKASEKPEGRDASDEIMPLLNVIRRVDYFPLFFHTFNGARIRRKKEPWVVHPPTQILSRIALTKQPNAYKSRSTSLRCILKSGGSLISVTQQIPNVHQQRGTTSNLHISPWLRRRSIQSCPIVHNVRLLEASYKGTILASGMHEHTYVTICTFD